MENFLKSISEAVLDGDMPSAQENVQAALGADVPAGAILQGALIPAMAEVGRLFEEGEYFVPEMLIAARRLSNHY